MKSIVAAIIVLSFLISCSSTGGVAVGEKAFYEASVTEQDTDQGKKPKAGSDRTSGKARADRKAARTVIVPDDDDDIASLLTHEDFKNFDLPIVFNDAVKYYVIYFTTEKKKIFANWLKRSRRYVPMIKEIMKEHGLPEDLVYLAMIESGFNPKAYSPAKACGPWQFIYETGGRYGLKVNFWIDERRDPEKSTVAAAKYLTDLFNQFGCWYLAAAGYNAGEKRVERAIEKHNTNDFWELAKYNALPKETREYIPRLIAAAIIAKDPERFGFGNIKYDEPLRFNEVKVPKASSLAAIAHASSMDLGRLKALNPELLRGITPPNMEDYKIKLPASIDVARFSDRIEDETGKERRIKGVLVYKIKKKDTLAKILKRYGVKEEELYLVNNCDDRLVIKPGMGVNIPTFTGHSTDIDPMAASITMGAMSAVSKTRNNGTEHTHVAKAEKVEKAEKDARHEAQKIERSGNHKEERPAKKTYHVAKKGETFEKTLTKRVPDKASFKTANSGNGKGERVRPNVKPTLAGHHVQKKKEKTATARYHTVRKGETLSQISGKYGVSMASLKSLNNLKSEKVQADMKLKISTGEG